MTPHIPAILRPAAVFGALLLAVATRPALAQQVGPSDLSLEALMQVTVEPVFGASLRLQPQTEAPASVTVVTAEDIARHGYETLGDILADTRGFYVTNDRNYSYVGARGFALPGDFNTRVLLLVDGHRINDPIYEQAAVGRDLALDVRTFERVEIIRGPASALYGTSAFLGVINVITKPGGAAQGVDLTVQGGTLGAQLVRLAVGKTFARGLGLTLSGTFGRRDGIERLYFPAFDSPDTNSGFAEGVDAEDFRHVSGRMSAGAWSIAGAVSSRDKQVPTASYDTVFGDPRLVTTDARSYVSTRFDKTVGGTVVALQASLDRYRYEGIYPEWSADPNASDIALLGDYAEGRWWSAASRVSRLVARRHTLTAGIDFRHAFREVQSGGYDGARQSEFLIANTSHVVGLYGQDEIELTPKLRLTAGLRYDRYAGFQRATPRVAAVFTTSADQAFKYLFGTAFRAPNAFELDYYSPSRRMDLDPEAMTSHEVIWERYSGRWLRTSASAYVNAIADLIRFGGADGEYSFENLGRVRSRGVELEAEARHRNGLRAQASYVVQDAVDRDAGTSLTNSPRHAWKLLASAPGPRHSTAALTFQYLSPRLALDGSEVGAVALANVSVRLPLTDGLRATALVRNLFNRSYADPGSAEHRQREIPQDGRTVLVGLEWNLTSR